MNKLINSSHFEYSWIKKVAQGCQGGINRILVQDTQETMKQQKNVLYTRLHGTPLIFLDYKYLDTK